MDYQVDGGGSRAVHDAVRPVLVEIQRLLGADLGVVVYQPVRDGGPPVALASATSGTLQGFLANEPVVTDRALPRRAPTSLDRLEIRSRLRPHGVRLRSSLAVPWRDQYGRGAVVVGNVVTPLADPESVLDEDLRRHLRRAIGRALGRARQAGSLQLGRELRAATRAMAEAAVSGPDGSAGLTTIIASTRELFRSEVAYLAVPDDTSGTFVFDQVLGIRTSSFRCLRVGHGQGLGGLARRTGRPVRSANYEADARLEAAPVDETRLEGIVSAMAAPVTVGQEIAAVLYVGDRRMRPFTAVDADLLEELAGHAAPGVQRRHTEADHTRALERMVRERVAYDLHDSVVRGLVAIGFEAEQARYTAPDGEAASRLETIARAAEGCMSRLRGELGVLLSGERTGSVWASEVLDRIGLLPERGVARSLELDGDDLEFSVAAADALVRVGQEAVTNAELHSGCAHLVIRVATSPHIVDLSVTDDGTFDGTATTDEPAQHFGMRGMHSAVAAVRGHVSIAPARPIGTLVQAGVPLWPSPGVHTP